MNETKKLLGNLNKPVAQPVLTPIGSEIFIPNHSGTHDAGIKNKVPIKDNDLVNKKYVDDEIAGIDLSDYVPYTGATSDVNLGSKNLTTTGNLKGNKASIGGGDILSGTYNMFRVSALIGTLPTLGSQVGIFQNNFDAENNCIFGIISGAGSGGNTGIAGFQFGDKDAINRGVVYYFNTDDALYLSTEGNLTTGLKIDNSQNIILTSDNQKLYFGAAQDASIFYDGTDLKINADDVGTGIVRFDSAYAEIYVADGSTAQSIATGTSYTKLTGFTTNGESDNCTADASNDKITITKSGRYAVQFNFSGSSGSANQVFRLAIFYDNTEVSKIHSHTKFLIAGDEQAISGSGIINCVAGKDIDVRARHEDAGSVNLTPEYMNLNVHYIGE